MVACGRKDTQVNGPDGQGSRPAPRGPQACSESLSFPDLYNGGLRTPTSQVEEGALSIWDRTAGVDSSRWVGV